MPDHFDDHFDRWLWIDDTDMVYDLSNPPGIEVTDYQGIGLPPTSVNTTPSAMYGTNVNLARINAHRITAVIQLQERSYDANLARLDNLRQALYPIGPNGPRIGQLEIRRVSGRTARIPAICESGLQQQGDWYEGPTNWNFAVVFLALRPTWRSSSYTDGVTETALALSGGIQWPLTWPFQVTSNKVQYRQTVHNAGDAIATQVEYTLIPGPRGMLNPRITHENSGRFAALNTTISDGQTLLLYNQTPDDIGARVNNQPFEQHLNTASRGMPLFLGANDFTFQCDQGEGTVQMRYLPEYNGG